VIQKQYVKFLRILNSTFVCSDLNLEKKRMNTIIMSFDSDDRIKQNALKKKSIALARKSQPQEHIEMNDDSFDLMEADKLDRTMENHDDFEIFNKRNTVTNHKKQRSTQNNNSNIANKTDVDKNGSSEKTINKMKMNKISKVTAVLSGLVILLIAIIIIGLIYIFRDVLRLSNWQLKKTKKQNKINIPIEDNSNH